MIPVFQNKTYERNVKALFRLFSEISFRELMGIDLNKTSEVVLLFGKIRFW